MRLKMVFKLKKEELDIEYRRAFLSLLKHCFQLASLEVYEKFYGNGTPMKPFTFGVYLPQPKFNGDTIQLSSNEITLNFSTSQHQLGIYFYNSLIKQRRMFQPYPFPDDNSITLKRILLIKEKTIKTQEAVFKTLSPFLVRLHQKKENKDLYLTEDHELFKQQLEESIRIMIMELTGKQEKVEFIPLSMSPTIIIRHFGVPMESNSGIFKLKGSPEILEFIYQCGIGSRRSEGFGLLEFLG